MRSVLLLIVGLMAGVVAGFYSTAPTKVFVPALELDQTGPFAPKARELAALLKEANPHRELTGLFAFVDGLTPEDFPKALRQLQSAPAPNREEALDVLIGKWMEIDPQGALDSITLARGMEDRDLGKQVVSDMFEAWAAKDPEAALNAAHVLTGDERKAALTVTLPYVMEKDPAKAMEAARWPVGESPSDMIRIAFQSWAQRDVDGATQSMLAIKDVNERPVAISGMAGGLVSEDPKLAVKWLDRLPAGDVHDRALREVGNWWGDVDPKAAVTWLETMPPSNGRDEAVDDLAVGWANLDAAGAIRYGMGLPEGKERSSLLGWGVAQSSYNDALATLRWVDSLPASPTKDTAFARAVGYWTDYDAPAAAAYLSSIPDSEMRRNMFYGVANSWSYDDPAAAAKWVATLPDCPQTNTAKAAVVEKLAPENLADGIVLAKQLPLGKDYDSAAKSLSRCSLKTDPAAALKWAESIGDAKTREYEVCYALIWCKDRDKAAAHAAAQESSLTPEVKQKFLSGQLFFSYKDYIFGLKPGEVMTWRVK